MKQHFTDERTGISYTLQGVFYLSDLELPAEERQPIGVWGQRHLRYIKQNRRVLYTNLLTSGRLNSYLADIKAIRFQALANHYCIYHQNSDPCRYTVHR